MPGTPQTATLGVAFGPDGEKTRISPSPIPQTALPAPADRASAMFGSAGYKDQLRRDAASSAAVPLRHTPVTATASGHGHSLGSSGTASGERKMPWWIEDRHDANKDREAREREGVSQAFLSSKRVFFALLVTSSGPKYPPSSVSRPFRPLSRCPAHRDPRSTLDTHRLLHSRSYTYREWLARSWRDRSFAPLRSLHVISFLSIPFPYISRAYLCGARSQAQTRRRAGDPALLGVSSLPDS